MLDTEPGVLGHISMAQPHLLSLLRKFLELLNLNASHPHGFMMFRVTGTAQFWCIYRTRGSLNVHFPQIVEWQTALAGEFGQACQRIGAAPNSRGDGSWVELIGSNQTVRNNLRQLSLEVFGFVSPERIQLERQWCKWRT